MSTQHTPGPWRIVHELRDEDECVADLVNSYWVIRPFGARLGHHFADARLIAAAPELLEMVQRLLGEALADREGAPSTLALAEAKALIAKATGGAA